MKEHISEIKFTVRLDENRLPEELTWFATESELKTPQACKAFMLSIWDKTNEEALRIDLWTSEMRTDEMDKFFFETFMTMADTYLRANKNETIAEQIKNFGYTFGENTGIIKKR